jgi:RimJ/RimL family protein N-acetyltransferase
MADEGTGGRLAMDRVCDEAFIGWCGLTRWNPEYRSASSGYCLDDAAWGHGYATEAARALLQWAFDTLDLNRVQTETGTRNLTSARVLEKLGFVREGRLREDRVVNGAVSDSWVFGLLRRNWRPSPAPVPARWALLARETHSGPGASSRTRLARRLARLIERASRRPDRDGQ